MRTDRKFVIRPPKVALYAGIICSTFLGVFFLLMPFIFSDQADTLWLAYLLMSPFFLLSLFLVAFYKRFKIKICGFELYCQFFIRYKLVTFSDIDEVKVKTKPNVPEKMILYSKRKRLFSVEETYDSYEKLKKRLEEENIAFYTK